MALLEAGLTRHDEWELLRRGATGTNSVDRPPAHGYDALT